SGLIEIGSAIIDISENAKKQKEEEKSKLEELRNTPDTQINTNFEGKMIAYIDDNGQFYVAYLKDDKIDPESIQKVTFIPVAAQLMNYNDVKSILEKNKGNNNLDFIEYHGKCLDTTCNTAEISNNVNKVEEKKTKSNPNKLKINIGSDSNVQSNSNTQNEYHYVGNRVQGLFNQETYNIYYSVDTQSNTIKLYEKKYDSSKRTEVGNFREITNTELYSFDEKKVAELMFKAQYDTWLANTHGWGKTKDMFGNRDSNGNYYVEVKNVAYNNKYHKSLKFYDANELSKYLKSRVSQASETLVLRRSYQIKVFNKESTKRNAGTANVIMDITGRGGQDTGSGANSGKEAEQENNNQKSSFDWGTIEKGIDDYYARNMKFYSALESEDWIINPYRSTHWDDLCAPAIVYNLEKEKQIRCKYVSCLETQLKAGMPSYICDRDYGMEACLYLDSAQWHVTGGFFSNILPGLLRSFFTIILSMAPYLAYSAFCPNYLGSMNYGGSDLFSDSSEPAEKATLPKGGYDVACGLMGTALQWREITALFSGDLFSSIFSNDIPKDPAEIKDYCKEVDLDE
ncbi:MAG: hypothetical protein QXL18_04025, partial [Candidatus Woesearchaeota archaeon]